MRLAKHLTLSNVTDVCWLQKACIVHDMASGTDYRRLANHHKGLYFTGSDADQHLQQRFQEVTSGQEVKQETIQVMMGRTITAPKAGESL